MPVSAPLTRKSWAAVRPETSSVVVSRSDFENCGLIIGSNQCSMSIFLFDVMPAASASRRASSASRSSAETGAAADRSSTTILESMIGSLKGWLWSVPMYRFSRFRVPVRVAAGSVRFFGSLWIGFVLLRRRGRCSRPVTQLLHLTVAALDTQLHDPGLLHVVLRLRAQFRRGRRLPRLLVGSHPRLHLGDHPFDVLVTLR